MIRKAVLLFTLCFAQASFAGEEQCKRDCDETVSQCKDMCKMKLGKTEPGKVGNCQQMCKEFTNECIKSCNEDKDDH